MKSPYEDIIHLPHHVSAVHRPMSMHDRAAQFSSFAALTGYEDAVAESGRLTEKKRELDEAEKAELNRKLHYLSTLSAENAPEVAVQYFVPDKRKAGGSYQTVTGKIAQIHATERYIEMTGGVKIPIDEISTLESNLTDLSQAPVKHISINI